MAQTNWSEQALEELADINYRLSENSETYADFVVDAILEAVDMLSQIPRMGRVVQETGIESVRELIIKKYRIIYFIAPTNDISIISVRHSSRPLSSPEI
ncbi:MAG: type II toxin-antitoxin system RelE/ParE family toxin [Alphaproteobacteria bacterium]|nr:type II toxin-antitoxin system RelE/ParE family toxin [Lewinellaceae bacterium]MBL8677311.1 type II toxin-antitoxin system RelE/ParE family toxin [Alphaproteobacteria bacterium]